MPKSLLGRKKEKEMCDGDKKGKTKKKRKLKEAWPSMGLFDRIFGAQIIGAFNKKGPINKGLPRDLNFSCVYASLYD